MPLPLTIRPTLAAPRRPSSAYERALHHIERVKHLEQRADDQARWARNVLERAAAERSGSDQ